MFLFSKKGGVLLLALGVLLSLLGPSHAIKCFQCEGHECDVAGLEPRECECHPETTFCVRRTAQLYVDGGEEWVQESNCGAKGSQASLGCTEIKTTGFPPGSLDCVCGTDACNTKDIMTSAGGTGGTKSEASPSVLTAYRFGVLGSAFLLLTGQLCLLSS